MSMFRKPKKPIQRRVFSGYSDEEDVENSNQIDAMDTEDSNDLKLESRSKNRKKDKSHKEKSTTKSSSLLSFDDDGM